MDHSDQNGSGSHRTSSSVLIMFLPRHIGCDIKLNTLLDVAPAFRIYGAICLFSPYLFITLAELSIDKNTCFFIYIIFK